MAAPDVVDGSESLHEDSNGMSTPAMHGSTAQRHARGRPRASRDGTVASVLQLIDQQRWPLHLADLCRVAGVSERTMRTIIKEQFELGPSRYLRLRRLQMLHDALAHADRHGATVAEVSARFGYAHGGRMASEYHQLFGEYPSQTLGRDFPASDLGVDGTATAPADGVGDEFDGADAGSPLRHGAWRPAGGH
ncbi:helix-turn-helix domain-containing protein [Lysobacter sp. S4-A87]|uniref:helix-turn-helix domain-containing protein n=1 Tax=Lysobacter sp. S4-A87 TaxID=2925843 RepID=UPI001F536371|nr:helix-turn-helix domain-containing protein [Lysobacter sp. S4-A87]UNK50862.1 helix-turn-helix domain-containing protein [Lysobacter sp. S4-A87]